MALAIAERFRLLSEPTRLRLLDLMADGERSVGSLAGELGCTQANVSKHLALLADGIRVLTRSLERVFRLVEAVERLGHRRGHRRETAEGIEHGEVRGGIEQRLVLALAVHDIEELLRVADIACALSVEALLGTTVAYGERVVGLRPAGGQADSAANLRALLQDSPIVASHRPSRHAVQDAYSLRCAPQVHGAARDVAGFCRQTVEHELASVVDNPVVLGDEVVSAGNFHGQALAYAADMLAATCADVAAISERRVDRLLDPARSRGLPAFLTPEPGLNSGLMITQYTAAAMVASLRHAATPFAVQSAATSAGQEDHVSMGYEAALRTRRSVGLLRAVLAIEVLSAAQAIEMRHPLRPAAATGAVIATLRKHTPSLAADRILSGDLEAAEAWASNGEWRDALAAAGVALR